MKSSPLNRRQRGFVTIYVVFTSLVLIPVVGLAVDFSVLYNVKARLQTAVDAGCIAAGYTLQRTTDMGDSSQINAVKATALSFFNANYPTGYWGSTQASYNPQVGNGPNSTRVISITASENVPLLFLRVLGLSQSTVAATAQVSVRFLTMMIVVDRSGSVGRAGNTTVVENALTQFIGSPGTSPFVDGRDVIGLVSFGGTTNLDLPPTASFRTGTPTFTNAVTSPTPPSLHTEWGNNATNTVDGLHQAYAQLQALNQTGALNVIVLLTDGRPSAFTATFASTAYAGTSTCTNKITRTGFVSASVGDSWPPLPPTTQGGAQGSTRHPYAFGVFDPAYGGLDASTGGDNKTYAGGDNAVNCNMLNTSPAKGSNAYLDFTTFPATDAYGNHTTDATTLTTFLGAGQNLNNPRAVRYASINAADNQATTIRQDTTLHPVMFVIGLNEPPTEELLDPDWLARVANDPDYKDSFGNSVFQAGQTPGKYYNVSGSGLASAFQDIASQILRLSQ